MVRAFFSSFHSNYYARFGTWNQQSTQTHAEFNHESMNFHNVNCQNSTYFQHDAQHSIKRSNN